MTDQATRLRMLAREGLRRDAPPRLTRAGAPPRLILVLGGKGGVGSTTVAVNLAAALAWDGQQVLLVDADLQAATATMQCGLEPLVGLADVLAGRQTLHEVLLPGPGGLHVLPSVFAPGIAEVVSETAQLRLFEALVTLGPHAETVVLDAGQQLAFLARRAWQAADQILVVSTADDQSLLNTYALLKQAAVERTAGDVSLLMTAVPQPLCGSQPAERLRRACQRFLGVRIGRTEVLSEVGCESGPPRHSRRRHDPEGLLARQLSALVGSRRKGRVGVSA